LEDDFGKYLQSLFEPPIDQSEPDLEMADDIANMTLEEYSSRRRSDLGPGLVRPAIAENVEFEIKGQFLKELRENPFRGEENDDANEHVERIVEIADMFSIPNITCDQVML
jgi:hypothetical protein